MIFIIASFLLIIASLYVKNKFLTIFSALIFCLSLFIFIPMSIAFLITIFILSFFLTGLPAFV